MTADAHGSPTEGRKGPAPGSRGPKAGLKKTVAIGPPAFPLCRRFGGHTAIIQPLQPSDRDTLLSFFESHTQETIHLRYGYEVKQISNARAAELVGVDQSVDAALGIFEPAESVPLVAIGRYCLTPEGNSAEVAFVVREDRRRHGMATALLEELLRIAGSRGLATLEAQVLRENQPMLEIFGRLGGVRAAIPGTDSVTVTIDVSRALRRLGKWHGGP